MEVICVKKVFLVTLTVVLVATLSFAGAFGAGFGLRNSTHKQVIYTELIKALDLTEDQAQQLLNAISETKAQLEALESEYEALLEKSKALSLNEFSAERKSLDEKRIDILQEFQAKVENLITVGQLENLKDYINNNANQYRQQIQGRYQQISPAKGRMPAENMPRMGRGDLYGRFGNVRFGFSGSFVGLGILLDDDFEAALKTYLG